MKMLRKRSCEEIRNHGVGWRRLVLPAVCWIVRTSHEGACVALSLLPPSIRIVSSGGREGLRRDCERESKLFFDEHCGTRQSSSSAELVDLTPLHVWDLETTSSFEVAATLFSVLAHTASARGVDGDERLRRVAGALWFPSVNDRDSVAKVAALAKVVEENANALGDIEKVRFVSWPSCPATGVMISWEDTMAPVSFGSKLEVMEAATIATQKTREWVEDTLCRLRLCPFTFSRQRSAVGLESVGVQEGPIEIRHAALPRVGDEDRQVHAAMSFPASALLATFWESVCEIATTPEGTLATFLIIAPSQFDQDFGAFCSVCDDILEPAVRAAGAERMVGRAWFHPMYDADVVGHDTVKPGHALPHSMVKSFVDTYAGSLDQIGELFHFDTAEGTPLGPVAWANNAVRRSPHATINILRRSQLDAAKEFEAQASVKRPNAVYARNVLRLIRDRDGTNITRATNG